MERFEKARRCWKLCCGVAAVGDEAGLTVLVVGKEQPGSGAGRIIGDQAWPIGQQVAECVREFDQVARGGWLCSTLRMRASGYCSEKSSSRRISAPLDV
jgi:hypothetical protein